MNKWLVVHDYSSYKKHNDLIGDRVQGTYVTRAKTKVFRQIIKGDKIVYYIASKASVIIGIFDVVSDIFFTKTDWGFGEQGYMVFSIAPSKNPPKGHELDFRKLIKDHDFSFITNKVYWGSYLQGKTAIKLTNDDFKIIKSNISNPKYLTRLLYKQIPCEESVDD